MSFCLSVRYRCLRLLLHGYRCMSTYFYLPVYTLMWSSATAPSPMPLHTQTVSIYVCICGKVNTLQYVHACTHLYTMDRSTYLHIYIYIYETVRRELVHTSIGRPFCSYGLCTFKRRFHGCTWLDIIPNTNMYVWTYTFIYRCIGTRQLECRYGRVFAPTGMWLPFNMDAPSSSLRV